VNSLRKTNNFPLKRALYCVFILFSIPFLSLGQLISTSTPPSVQDMVLQNLGTACIEINNVILENDGAVINVESYGNFNRSSSNFPFQQGFVLTTGSLFDTGNNPIATDLNVGTTAWTGDADLESALGINNTLNATSLKMEVTSATGLLQFNYILASEEYQQDFPCNVSDGFALLIRPLGTTALENIALVPDTNIGVGISIGEVDI
jgi:hypothetical protein